VIAESLARFVRPVVIARPTDSVGSAARQLREARVGSVVVVRAERVVGILTDRDIALRVVAEGLDAERTRVEEIMTRDPLVVGASDTLSAAVRIMQEHGVRRLPIVDETGHLLGILTADDLVAELGALLAAIGGVVDDPADSDDSR
jgi:CBS domain-containing protein